MTLKCFKWTFICVAFTVILLSLLSVSPSADDDTNPRIAKWYLEDDFIKVDTKSKTITLPNSLVVMAGINQKTAFGFSGGVVFTYDVKGIGNGCKVVFNPHKKDNNSKFYVVARDYPLSTEEYYFCGIILNPFHLAISAEKVLVDGRHPLKSKDHGKNSVIFYDGEKIEIPLKSRNMLACEFIGEKVCCNDIEFQGNKFYAQGLSMYGNYMFRLCRGSNDEKTLCMVYELKDDQPYTLIDKFYLGFNEGSAHANTCQFGNMVDLKSGFPLLYVRNGNKHACVVERINLHQSEVIQRINIDIRDIFPHGGGEGNTIMGDDGYIWYFGETNGYQYFAKFTPPSLNKKEVTLTAKDMVDSWEIRITDNYENRTWQGGKVKDGKIYFLYGTGVDSNRLYIFDIKKKQQISLIPLSSIIEEVEDLDFTDSSLFISISSAKNGIDRLNETY